MLENKDVYKSRDVTTTEMVAIMMELKYFDEQFMYYGCAYAKDGHVEYRINNDVSRLYRFLENSEAHNVYPTNIMRYVRLLKVPSGKEREKAEIVENEFLKKLQEAYPLALFQALDELGNTPALNSAGDLLRAWQERLEVCYDVDQIELYRGAVQLAYDAKVLDEANHETLSQWITSRLELIDNCENVIWNDKRYFYGFVYWQNNKIKVYSNAEEYIVNDHRYELMTDGVLCSAIFKKHYWFDSKPDLSIQKWRMQFEGDLKECWTEENIDLFNKLCSLPAAVNKDDFMNWKKQLENVDNSDQNRNAQTVMDYYKTRWLVK